MAKKRSIKKINKAKNKSFFSKLRKQTFPILIAVMFFGSMILYSMSLKPDSRLDFNGHSFKIMTFSQDGQEYEQLELKYLKEKLYFYYHPTNVYTLDDDLIDLAKNNNHITFMYDNNISVQDKQMIYFSINQIVNNFITLDEKLDFNIFFVTNQENQEDISVINCSESYYEPIIFMKLGNQTNHYNNSCYNYYLRDSREALMLLEGVTYQILDVIPHSNFNLTN